MVKEKDKKRLLKGHSDFEYMISNNGYYVDKTLFVKEFMEHGDHTLIIPRPRRFGKTLNLSMTEHFFDIRKPDSKQYFEEYNISKEKAFCEKHQNKYPVINLTLKSVGGLNWERCYKRLKGIIFKIFKEHDFLLNSGKLDDIEKQEIKNIIYKKEEQADYENSLINLSNYLFKHYDRKIIILIDEYDNPIIDGYRQGYYSEIIDFMQTFLGEAFKGNSYLEKGLITGILRVAKESIFSKFNNPGIYSITNHKFADKFGFTEPELIDLVNYFDAGELYEQIKQWYNGYKIGGTTDIYNPWSIIGFLMNREDGFRPYWINSGSDPLIKQKILEPDPKTNYDILQKLITGESIKKKLHENFVFKDMESHKELLWTLLTYSGYLTIDQYLEDDIYYLKVPNYEIRKVFKDIVVDWWEIKHRVNRFLLQDTVLHLINNRIEEFEKGFKDIMGDTFSYFDTGGEPEKVYQAYILGILAFIGDDYIIKSNRESGEGRYDIMLLPKNKTLHPNGVVMEIKQIENRENESQNELAKRVNGKLKEAMNQIESKKYYKELLAHNVPKIIKLPIVFVGKEPYVRLINEEK